MGYAKSSKDTVYHLTCGNCGRKFTIRKHQTVHCNCGAVYRVR